MVNTIVKTVVILIELLIGKMFFDIFLKKKKESGIFKLIIILVTLELLSIYVVDKFYDQIFLKIIIVVITEIVFWNWYYNANVLKIGVIYLLVTGLAFLLDYLTVICVCKINSKAFFLLENNNAFSILVQIFGKINNILFILILWSIFKKKKPGQMNQKGWLCTFVFSIFTIVVLVMLATNWDIVQNDTQANILLCVSASLVVMNIFMFYVINNILETEAANREKGIFKERLAREIETYHTIEENAAAQRRLIHEFRNILSVITASKDMNSDAIVELAKKESQKLDEAADTVNTENVIVNMVLNTKIKEIRKKDIGILLDVGDLSDLKMEHEDIVIILSNLLNNAIEACEQCKNKKMIWIKCAQERMGTIFSVRNTYDIEPVKRNGKYLTTKTENREMHGMGINNIINTVEKYKGSYAIHTENHEFIFTITIPD